eukprot:gene4565-4820_t
MDALAAENKLLRRCNEELQRLDDAEISRLYDEVQRRDESLLEAHQKINQLQTICVNLLEQLQHCSACEVQQQPAGSIDQLAQLPAGGVGESPRQPAGPQQPLTQDDNSRVARKRQAAQDEDLAGDKSSKPTNQINSGDASRKRVRLSQDTCSDDAGQLQQDPGPAMQAAAEVAANGFGILLDWAAGLCGQQPWLQELQALRQQVIHNSMKLLMLLAT